MLVLQLRVRPKKELTKATSQGSVVVEDEDGCDQHIVVAYLRYEGEWAATMGERRNGVGELEGSPNPDGVVSFFRFALHYAHFAAGKGVEGQNAWRR